MQTDKEIIAGNILIAEFEGYKFNDSRYQHFNVIQPGESEWYFASWPIEDFNEHIKEKFQYHSSWNKLMPVVEKISRIEMGRQVDEQTLELMIWTAYPTTFGMPNPTTGRPMVRFTGNALFEADTLIEATWLAVVDFINWYNTQSK